MVEASTRLRIRVSPGARRARLVGRHGDAWKVSVTAPAEGGRANEAVVRLLADALELPRRAVSLVSGHTARDKIVALTGLDEAEATRRLAALACDAAPEGVRALPARPSDPGWRERSRRGCRREHFLSALVS